MFFFFLPNTKFEFCIFKMCFLPFISSKQVCVISELSSRHSIHHFEVGLLVQNSNPILPTDPFTYSSNPDFLKHIPPPIPYTLIPSKTILKPYLLNNLYQRTIPSLLFSYYIYSILHHIISSPLPPSLNYQYLLLHSLL